MSSLKLDTIDVSKLDLFDNRYDLRRDVHLFVDYVRNREVKRAYRTNDLPKADAKRLAKLMNDQEAFDEIGDTGSSSWLEYVSYFALALGFVDYDTEGEYAGYRSHEPTFKDNYIIVNRGLYDEFVKTNLANHEQRFQKALFIEESNEFLHTAAMGRLTSFSIWGSATGVMPLLDFVEARRFLLKELAKFESGIWYSTASLVAYFKKNYPYFLIPKSPNYTPRRGKKTTRYGNFYESKDFWGYNRDTKSIADDAIDGFERVEGRYIERFLEGLPRILGYVDVAYSNEPYEGLHPHLNYLQAFRVNELLHQVMERRIPKPRVTVQPNYEIHVESLLYPSSVLNRLRPLGKEVSTGTITVLKLDKRKVTELHVQNENLDVVKLLTDLSDRPLPQNIKIELEEWAGHSDKFILYDGFSLLETNQKRLPIADPYTVEMIDEKIRLVQRSSKLYRALEEAERFPLRVRHGDDQLKALPSQAKTIFRSQRKEKTKPKTKPKLLLKRRTLTTLHFPDMETRDLFLHALVAARCPVESMVDQAALSYDHRYEQQVEAVFEELGKAYKINFVEM